MAKVLENVDLLSIVNNVAKKTGKMINNFITIYSKTKRTVNKKNGEYIIDETIDM